MVITDDHNPNGKKEKFEDTKKTPKESKSVKNKIKSIWRWVHNNQLSVKNKIQEQSMFWQVVMRFTQLTRHDTNNCTNIYLHTICLTNILIGQNMVIMLAILQRWRYVIPSIAVTVQMFLGDFGLKNNLWCYNFLQYETNIYNDTFNFSPSDILYLLTNVSRIHESRID